MFSITSISASANQVQVTLHKHHIGDLAECMLQTGTFEMVAGDNKDLVTCFSIKHLIINILLSDSCCQ